MCYALGRTTYNGGHGLRMSQLIVRLTMEISNVCFLLVQGEVIDVCEKPDKLNFAFVDEVSGFQVAIACTNEFGEQEVIGIVAEMLPMLGCTTWRVSSEIDGHRRMVGVAGSMKDFIQKRLRAYRRLRLFADLCQLPAQILIEGEK